MLNRRAKVVTWLFLLGVIVSEGLAIVLTFNVKGNWLTAIGHYIFTPFGTPQAWLLAAAITLAYVGFSASGSPIIAKHMLRPSRWQGYWGMIAVAVPMALISGFFEEAFFRKSLMDIAMHQGAGIGLQIASTALAFGAVHAVWGLLGGSVRAAVGAMLATGALGAALGVVYVLGGRSVAPCIFAHIAINLTIEPWLAITVATGSWTRAAPIPGASGP